MRAPIVRLLFTLACLGSLPSAAHASSLNAMPGEVRAGEIVELRWEQLPIEVKELEFEISLDGGPWQRISPEMEPHAGRYRWRVPRWPCLAARLRMRMGGEGFERTEPAGAAFRIVVDPRPGEGRAGSVPQWDRFAIPAPGQWRSDGPEIRPLERSPALVAPETQTLERPAAGREPPFGLAPSATAAASAGIAPRRAPPRVMRN